MDGDSVTDTLTGTCVQFMVNITAYITPRLQPQCRVPLDSIQEVVPLTPAG
jgi:hypothetical protein